MSEATFDEPAGTTHLCGKAWGGLRSLGAYSISTFNTWRQRMDQNSLERALAQIIETANGHRAKGLPKGSPAYIVLRDNAKAKVKVFAMKWDVDIDRRRSPGASAGRSGEPVHPRQAGTGRPQAAGCPARHDPFPGAAWSGFRFGSRRPRLGDALRRPIVAVCPSFNPTGECQ